MSHKVIQVIKLVKYKRKSHEMIRATCKAYRQRNIHNNEHSHEMTQFRNRIVIWSSLHEPVQIYGSSHRSVFEQPVHRVHNEHESESGTDLLQWSGSHRTNPKHCSTPQNIQININTHLIPAHKHTRIPAYIRIRVYAYTNIHAYLNKYQHILI